jgi:hypothetical protein
MQGKTLVKMVHKKSGHELICCKLTYIDRKSSL